MKSLFITATFIFSLSAQANSYCYDRGLFALQRLEDSLLACKGQVGMNASIPVLRKMENRFTSKNPLFYTTRLTASLAQVDQYMKELPSTECNAKVAEAYKGEERARIVYSINLCQ